MFRAIDTMRAGFLLLEYCFQAAQEEAISSTDIVRIKDEIVIGYDRTSGNTF